MNILRPWVNISRPQTNNYIVNIVIANPWPGIMHWELITCWKIIHMVHDLAGISEMLDIHLTNPVTPVC